MKNYQKYMSKLNKSRKLFWIYFFNKQYNLTYFTKELKSQRKCSISFKDLQVSFFKHLKSNFFFGGDGGLSGGKSLLQYDFEELGYL